MAYPRLDSVQGGQARRDYESLLRSRLSDIEIRSLVPIEQGWDSLVFEINGELIIRLPRRVEVEDWLRKEIALLPDLADVLPAAIPRFEFLNDEGGLPFVGYRKLPGERIDVALAAGSDAVGIARQLGRFLAALHSFNVTRAEALGLEPADDRGVTSSLADFIGRCRSQVLPLLDEAERKRAERMFEKRLASESHFDVVLIHGDLGPAHILCDRSEVSGVIDWSDCRLGDPAQDFGWLLYGLGSEFARALRDSYLSHQGVFDDQTGSRALFYHRLGPWWEVIHGLEEDEPNYVRSGLTGVRQRLP